VSISNTWLGTEHLQEGNSEQILLLYMYTGCTSSSVYETSREYVCLKEIDTEKGMSVSDMVRRTSQVNDMQRDSVVVRDANITSQQISSPLTLPLFSYSILSPNAISVEYHFEFTPAFPLSISLYCNDGKEWETAGPFYILSTSCAHVPFSPSFAFHYYLLSTGGQALKCDDAIANSQLLSPP